MNAYHIDLDALTIIRTDANGEEHDLNAGGEPCQSEADVLHLAAACGLTICKYADPEDDARDGLSISDALDIMADDASLIYVR